MANTGYKHYLTRRQYFVDPATGLIDLSNPTGVSEANVAGDNYVADDINYDSCPLGTSVQVGDPAYNSGIDACAAGDPSTECWHDGVGTYPTLQDTIYEDPGFVDFYSSGANRFHEIGGGSFRIDALGVVTELFACP